MTRLISVSAAGVKRSGVEGQIDADKVGLPGASGSSLFAGRHWSTRSRSRKNGVQISSSPLSS